MKKQIFTLLTLALMSTSFAWAEVLCTAQLPAGQEGTFSNLEGTTVGQSGCVLKWDGLQGGTNAVNVSGVDYYKLGSDGAYVQIALSAGSFQAGDVLTATVTSNGNNKIVNIKVNASYTPTVKVSSTETQDIVYTLTAADIESDGSIKIYRGNSSGSNLRVGIFSVSGMRTTESFTVTFNAGSNGSCATASITEASPMAGVILPAVTVNEGYKFLGWFTAATDGTKVGNTGDEYHPVADITVFAQYAATLPTNFYYIAEGDEATDGDIIYCKDLEMKFVSSGSFNAAISDDNIEELNALYAASIASTQNNWATVFTPELNGILTVGIVVNGGKTLTVTNVDDFISLDKNGNVESHVGNTWTPTEKFYGIIKINAVQAGTSYSISVGGSKMSFYGFEFMPIPYHLTLGENGYSTFAADFSYTVAGATVYKAALNGAKDAVILTEVSGAVPADEGIILKGTAGDEVAITPSNVAAGDFTGNELVGVVGAKKAVADTYVISTNAGVTAFNPCEVGVVIPSHKAFMNIPEANGAPIRIAETATNIENVAGNEDVQKFIENGKLLIRRNGVVYDITGAIVK